MIPPTVTFPRVSPQTKIPQLFLLPSQIAVDQRSMKLVNHWRQFSLMHEMVVTEVVPGTGECFSLRNVQFGSLLSLLLVLTQSNQV